MYYPPAIREATPFNSEVRDASEEAEAAGPGAKESEPSGAAETSEGQNPDASQETVESTSDAQVSHAEGPVLLVEPLQAVPLGEGSKDLETSPAQLSEGRVENKPKE